MFGTYIGNNKMLVKVVYNGMLTISATDLSLMPSLVTNGYIEMPLTKFFINNVKPGCTVVDIGTNVGYFTILAGMLVGNKGKVYGYEANVNVFHLLQDNVSMNWLTQQIQIQNKAIYSKNTNLEFNVSTIFQGDSSINNNSMNDLIDNSFTTVNVEAVSLDKELRNIKSIDLLKIDIEGGEYHAFLGMLEVIEQKKIKKVIFEWNKKMLGEDAGPFADLLKDILYKYDGLIYKLGKEGEALPTTVDYITSSDFYPFALIEFI